MTKNCARDAKGTRPAPGRQPAPAARPTSSTCGSSTRSTTTTIPDWIVEKGALAEALKAQKEGKVRFIGFTGHKSPHIHQKMLDKHEWDTVQMPINVCDYYYRSFAQGHAAAARRNKGIGAIGMKSLGGGNQPKRAAASSPRRSARSKRHAATPCRRHQLAGRRHRLDEGARSRTSRSPAISSRSKATN